MIFDFEEWVVIDLESEIENIQVFLFLPMMMVMLLSHCLFQFCVVEDFEIEVQYSSTLNYML